MNISHLFGYIISVWILQHIDKDSIDSNPCSIHHSRIIYYNNAESAVCDQCVRLKHFSKVCDSVSLQTSKSVNDYVLISLEFAVPS